MSVVETARRLADDYLFVRALETDAAPVVPRDRLDVLAEGGLYGLVGPREAGGLAADPATVAAVMETLAGGCLTTAFVWAQHHNAVATVASAAPQAVRERFLAELCAGRLRAGVAFAGLRRPGPPILVAERRGASIVLDGAIPWLTGWGRIDLVHVAARDAAGDVVWLLADAAAGPSFEVSPLDLAAVNASATVSARLEGHVVDAERVTLVEPFAAWVERDAAGLRRNGAMALGVAGRCSRLSGEAAQRRELDECRAELATAEGPAVARARAWAADLAVRSASALVAAGGGRSMLRSEQAQRLAREALFLLVFGQTASIREAELDLYRHRAAVATAGASTAGGEGPGPAT